MRTFIFIVSGLLLGLLGGTAVGGLTERDNLLEEMEARKLDQEQAPQTLDEKVDSLPAEPAPAEQVNAPKPRPQSLAGKQEGEEEPAVAEPPSSQAEGSTPTAEGGASPSTSEEAGKARATEDAGVPGKGPAAEPLGSDRDRAGEGASGTVRLAGIFGAMRAEDAARVLQNLDDEEVQAILFHLSDRKAAEILGNFEPTRAAALSRVVLGTRGHGQP